MKKIFFPSQYKKPLLKKTKTSTIRIGNEIGKYKVGKIYCAESYAGKDWNVKIKILNISLTTLNRLFEFGIPKLSIDAIRRKEKISFDEEVELIRFKVF